MLTRVATTTHCNIRQHTAKHRQHIAIHCNTLRYSAAHCNTLSVDEGSIHTNIHTYKHTCHTHTNIHVYLYVCYPRQHGCTTIQKGIYNHVNKGSHCNTMQRTATHCITLQYTVTHCNTLQHTATHCNTLQHTETHCNTLQRIEC